MARNQRKASRSGGGMLFGFVLGLVLGLAAAVAVALFVTKAPVPFVDKASRARGQGPLANVREAPDPNRGLGGRPTAEPSRTAQAQAPDTTADTVRGAMTQDIDQLIASLGQGRQQGTQASGTPSDNTPSHPTTTVTSTQTLYYLQAGAFRSKNDAEALKARILMLGLNGFVQPVQVDGVTLHRVRVGPFHGIDEMNQSRIALGKGNISSAVVRP